MSPSEFDLRNALRDGEGDDDLDVDRIVAGAHAHRSQRRTRILSSSAAAVVVAAAAVGGAVLWGGNGGGHRSTAADHASAGATASSHAPNADSGALHGATATGSPDRSPDVSSGSPGNPGVPVPATGGATAARTCPSQFPHTLLPGGGSPGQFGASGPMFAHPVATVLVCEYASSQPDRVASATLAGPDAAALASSIEHASASRLVIACPDIVTGNDQQLAIIAYTAGGTAMPTVTTDISVPDCNQPITNGTAVRYGWQPPSGLRTQLALLPDTAPIQPGTGRSGMNGSPAR